MSLSLPVPHVAAIPTAAPAGMQSAMQSGPFAKLWRRRSLFLAVAGTVMVLTLAAWLVMRPQYLATGSVIVAEQEPGAENASIAWIQKLGDPADIESQLLVIRSPRLMRLALEDGKMAEAAMAECLHRATTGVLSKVLPSKEQACLKLGDTDALIALLQSRFAAASAGRSRVINLSYKSALPDVAQTMVNTLIRTFLDDQRSTQAQSRRSASEWLRKEITQLDEALRDDEAAIQAFRRKKGLMKGATASITSERLTNVTQQLAAAEAAKAEAAARLREITADQGRGAANAPAVLASRAIGDLKQQLNATTAQLASNSAQLGPNHPSIRSLQTERNSLQARIDKEVTNVAESLRKTSQASDALAASLRQQLDKVKTDVSSAMDDEATLEGLTRNAEVKRKQYTDLVKRAGDLETEQRILSGSSRLVSLAELPNEPFAPKPVMLAAGFILALVLGAAAALLRDRADRKVRNSAELTTTVGAPVFAQLPDLQGREAGSLLGRLAERRRDLPLDEALEKAASNPAMQYALHSLNARLLMAGSDGSSRRILVTSAMPGEGKSFTTLAIAQLAATGRRRVLAIECDLRRPNFAQALGLRDTAGLAGVLRGEADPDFAVVRDVLPNLDILPAGLPTADSTELLMDRRMEELLDWTQHYDLVLLDSPPAKLLMDACVLATQVDGVLCCTRWGGSQLSDLIATVGAIRDVGGNVLGVAMTMAQKVETSAYDVRPLAAAPAQALGAH